MSQEVEKIEEGTTYEGGIIPAQEVEEVSEEQKLADAEKLGEELEYNQNVAEYTQRIEDLQNQGRHDEVPELQAELEEYQKSFNAEPEVEPEVKEDDSDKELTDEQKRIKELEAELEKLKTNDEPEVEVPVDDEIKEKLKDANISYDEVYKEHLEKGTLSEETLKDLEKAGFSKSVVEAIIETTVAKAEEVANQLISDVCGGQEEFTAMAEWMNDNMSKEELDEYDAGVESPHAKVYLQNAFNKFTSATKVEKPVTVRGGGNRPTTDGNSFNSQAEVIKAIGDRRYQTDHKYRAEVQRKVDEFYAR